MSPAFTNLTTTRDFTVQARVQDAPPLEHPRRPGVRINPETVTVHYVQNGEQPWTVRSVRVIGGIIRQSGNASSIGTPVQFWDLASAPEWVREFVEHQNPGRDVCSRHNLRDCFFARCAEERKAEQR